MPRTVDPAKYAERRAVILDAAAGQIAARGYDAVTIADVLAEAEVSKGALYHYFSSKEELLVGVIERRIDSWGAAIHEATNDVADPVERLIAFVRTLTATKTEDLTLLVSAMPQLDAAGNAAAFLQLRRAAADRFLPLIAEIIDGGIRAGAFRANSAESAAKVILSLLHEMSACATRDLLAIVEGRSSREQFHADMRAYADSIPAVLDATLDAGSFFGADEADRWVDAVLARFRSAAD